MKTNVLVILSLFLSSIAFAAPTLSNQVTWVNDFAKGMAQAKAENKPVMVDFYADWCGWCKKLDKTTYADPEVVKLSKDYVCIKVDTDSDSKTPLKYGVSGLPTIVFLTPKGEVIDTVVGYRDGRFFKQVLTVIKNAFNKK